MRNGPLCICTGNVSTRGAGVHFSHGSHSGDAEHRRTGGTARRGCHGRACAFGSAGRLSGGHRRLAGKRSVGDEDIRTERVRAILRSRGHRRTRAAGDCWHCFEDGTGEILVVLGGIYYPQGSNGCRQQIHQTSNLNRDNVMARDLMVDRKRRSVNPRLNGWQSQEGAAPTWRLPLK
jgi:hypothetical protein